MNNRSVLEAARHYGAGESLKVIASPPDRKAPHHIQGGSDRHRAARLSAAGRITDR
jgi:hypothetical protein